MVDVEYTTEEKIFIWAIENDRKDILETIKDKVPGLMRKLIKNKKKNVIGTFYKMYPNTQYSMFIQDLEIAMEDAGSEFEMVEWYFNMYKDKLHVVLNEYCSKLSSGPFAVFLTALTYKKLNVMEWIYPFIMFSDGDFFDFQIEEFQKYAKENPETEIGKFLAEKFPGKVAQFGDEKKFTLPTCPMGMCDKCVVSASGVSQYGKNFVIHIDPDLLRSNKGVFSDTMNFALRMGQIELWKYLCTDFPDVMDKLKKTPSEYGKMCSSACIGGNLEMVSWAFLLDVSSSDKVTAFSDAAVCEQLHVMDFMHAKFDNDVFGYHTFSYVVANKKWTSAKWLYEKLKLTSKNVFEIVKTYFEKDDMDTVEKILELTK